MSSNDVYDGGDGMLFSAAITRSFGVNRVVTLSDGRKVIAAVQPLLCDPVECELPKIGELLSYQHSVPAIGDWTPSR